MFVWTVAYGGAMRYLGLLLVARLGILSSAAQALTFPSETTVFSTPFFEVGGRSGSRRIGGYGSHGKGSHYVGGRASAARSSNSSSARSSGHSSRSLTGGSRSSTTRHSSSPSRYYRSTDTPGVKRDSSGKIQRSSAARAEFQRAHPCPSTGRSSGACPGYVVDHVTPLKRGGADKPSTICSGRPRKQRRRKTSGSEIQAQKIEMESAVAPIGPVHAS